MRYRRAHDMTLTLIARCSLATALQQVTTCTTHRQGTVAHAPARDVVPFPAAANRVSYLTLSHCSSLSVQSRVAPPAICAQRPRQLGIHAPASPISFPFSLSSTRDAQMQRRELFRARFRHAPPSTSARRCKRETLAGPTGSNPNSRQTSTLDSGLSASTSPFAASHRPPPCHACHHPSADMTANT